MAIRTLPLDRAFRLIEPGPVVLLSTSDDGAANVMAMTWHMMMEFTPPQIACLVSNANHSFAALRRHGECVIAVAPASLAKTVVAIGDCTGAEVDKIARFGLRTRKAKQVAPPLLLDCIGNLECRVIDDRLVPDYCLFVLEVVHAWIDPAQREAKMFHHRGGGIFAVDGRRLRLPFAKAV